MSTLRTLGFLLLAALLTVGCDNNIGRAFDPDVNRNGTPGTASTVQRMVLRGTAVDGRPRVREVFPSGNGWPATVPVVIEFNETINASTIQPQGGDANIFLRAEGSETALPAAVDTLLGGRFVILRPAQPFPTEQVVRIEVVVRPELRDGDGVRFGGSAPRVVGSFTPDEGTDLNDAEVVTVIPLDNSRDQLRESPVYVVFSKQANQNTVQSGATGSFQLRPRSGTAVAGGVEFPLVSGLGGGRDGRVAEFTPSTALTGNTDYEVVLNETITFGSGDTAGVLDFKGRSPFSTFRTLVQEDPESVVVGNPTTNFPDRVNRNNLENLIVDVQMPASTQAGDRAVVRIYGVEPSNTTPPSTEVAFVEQTAGATAGGAQTVSVSFAGRMGTVANPAFAEGQLTIAAQLVSGSRRTGFILSDTNNQPELDVTPPQLTQVGPPNSGNNVFTDQEYLSLFGTANEQLGAATLTANSATATGYGFSSDGRFLMKPILIGTLSAPLAYSLTITDTAGNMAVAATTGNVVQRGVVTGTLAPSGTLTVEAYNDATLATVAGVTVLVEPNLPQKPASGRVVRTTGTDGRAVFPGLNTSQPYTVTLIGTGFDLTTVLATTANFVSLPLRPTSSPTASLSGSVTSSQVAPVLPGQRALFSTNIFDDPLQLDVAATSATPLLMPSASIRPNRPFLVTSLVGTIEPTAVPSFTVFTCSICGANATTATPPQAAVTGGGSGTFALPLVATLGQSRNLATTFDKDFALATGLNNASLIGTPKVRVNGNLRGVPGRALMGLGFATQPSGNVWRANATYLSTAQALFVDFVPELWVSIEAQDTTGNISRHNTLILNPIDGTLVQGIDAPGIPTITTPGSAFTGSPSVTFQDRIDRSVVLSNFGFELHEITATDGNGRAWRVYREDQTNGTGTVAVQFPDLAGVSVAGLATGTWSIRIDSTLYLSDTLVPGIFLLDERRREEITFARSAAVSFTIN